MTKTSEGFIKRIAQLEAELAEWKARAEKAEMKCDELTQRLVLAEGSIPAIEAERDEAKDENGLWRMVADIGPRGTPADWKLGQEMFIESHARALVTLGDAARLAAKERDEARAELARVGAEAAELRANLEELLERDCGHGPDDCPETCAAAGLENILASTNAGKGYVGPEVVAKVVGTLNLALHSAPYPQPECACSSCARIRIVRALLKGKP